MLQFFASYAGVVHLQVLPHPLPFKLKEHSLSNDGLAFESLIILVSICCLIRIGDTVKNNQNYSYVKLFLSFCFGRGAGPKSSYYQSKMLKEKHHFPRIIPEVSK